MTRLFILAASLVGALGACAPSPENAAFNSNELRALTQLCVNGAGENGLIERGYKPFVSGYALAPPGGTIMQNTAVLTVSNSPCSIGVAPITAQRTITVMGRTLLDIGFTQVDDETFARGSERFRLYGRTGGNSGNFVSLTRL